MIQYWANQEPCFFTPHPLPQETTPKPPFRRLLHSFECLSIQHTSTTHEQVPDLYLQMNSEFSISKSTNPQKAFCARRKTENKVAENKSEQPDQNEQPDFVMKSAWFTTVMAGLFVWFCLFVDKEWIWILYCLFPSLSPPFSLSHTNIHTLSPTQTVEWEMVEYQDVTSRPM